METCNAVGCFKPRHKSTGGFEYAYCYQHWTGNLEAAKRDDQLVEGMEIVTKKTTCTVEGCEKQRMVNNKGVTLTMCEDHQRGYWREQAAKRNASKPASVRGLQPESSDPIAIAVDRVQAAVNGVGEAARRAFPETSAKIEAMLTDIHQDHDCNNCESKAVIEALRAKSPKLAKLIDAMQAEVEAAAELGI